MPSSVIETYTYDAATQVLTITFTTGRTYAYADVPAEIYEGFARALSKGRYFNLRIRDAYRPEEIKAQPDQPPSAKVLPFRKRD